MDQIIKELDRVTLKTTIKIGNTLLSSGLVGTIVFCFPRGYEIEFDGINSTFDIDAKYIMPYVPHVIFEEENNYEEEE